MSQLPAGKSLHCWDFEMLAGAGKREESFLSTLHTTSANLIASAHSVNSPEEGFF